MLFLFKANGFFLSQLLGGGLWRMSRFQTSIVGCQLSQGKLIPNVAFCKCYWALLRDTNNNNIIIIIINPGLSLLPEHICTFIIVHLFLVHGFWIFCCKQIQVFHLEVDLSHSGSVFLLGFFFFFYLLIFSPLLSLCDVCVFQVLLIQPIYTFIGCIRSFNLSYFLKGELFFPFVNK